MRQASKNIFASKDANQLISGSMYNGARTLDNVAAISGIWLDNEDGDLTRQQFAAMYPDFKMVIFNTYSSTTQAPRWRAFIPTSHLMSIDAHKEIIAQIMQKLRKRKYYGKSYFEKNPHMVSKVLCHGFDESKFNAASIFFMPCQAKAGAEHSFFEIYNASGSAIDPYQWIDKTTIDHQAPPLPVVPSAAVIKVREAMKAEKLAAIAANANNPLMVAHMAQQRQDWIDEATDAYRSASHGTGNRQIYRLARRLWDITKDTSDVENILIYETSHNAARRKDAELLIKKLKRGKLDV